MIPKVTVDDPTRVNKLGTIISRPDVNRAIMGATAILTQPAIDYNNRKVDKATATVSTYRTIGKVIAGTTVGCGVRSACYYLTKACTSQSPNASKWRKWLMPSENTQRTLAKRNKDWFKNYNNTLATLLGLGAMLFTNVALDVPLTNAITKLLIKDNKSSQQERKGA
jgi:hypothetical protein